METSESKDLPKSNEIVTLTDRLDRLFKAGGCDPTCHCCKDKIHVGQIFKLGRVSEEQAKRAWDLRGWSVFKSGAEHDVMLCGKDACSPEQMITDKLKKLDEYARKGLTPHGDILRSFLGGSGCSIVNGKIVV